MVDQGGLEVGVSSRRLSARCGDGRSGGCGLLGRRRGRRLWHDPPAHLRVWREDPVIPRSWWTRRASRSRAARRSRATTEPPGSSSPAGGAYKIVAKGEGGAAETATAAVAVRGAGPEDADAAPRPELLSAIAEASGGAFDAIPGGALPDLRLSEPAVVEIGRRKALPIWDRAWFLAALALALGGDWILRRRWGWW